MIFLEYKGYDKREKKGRKATSRKEKGNDYNKASSLVEKMVEGEEREPGKVT